jgi:hypothetical protein
VFEDLRVIEALQALKAAVLAVNGDKEVVSEILLFDVRKHDGKTGMAVLNMNVCSCPACINRFIDMLGGELNEAAGQYVTGKKRALH